jgi:hypothetical protein
MKFAFKFPRVDAETIIMEGATYGEAADKAIEERKKHVSPVKADGDVYDKPSMTNPKGVITGS